MESSSNPVAESQGLRSECLHFGDSHVFDLAAHTLYIGYRRVELTRREYELLRFLSLNPNRAFSRDELIAGVWGQDFGGYAHTVSAHVNRLRAKIEADPANPSLIATVWGLGYRFEPEPARHNAAG